MRLISRGVWLLIRQSSTFQRRYNKGSEAVQREQARVMAPFGVSAHEIKVVDARGESGAAGAHRTKFKQLLAEAEAGRVGVLLLAKHDRLGRSDDDSARLYSALREAGSLVIVDGRLFDPREPQDKLQLGLQAEFAEFENAARARWLQLARWAMARRGQYRVALPSGLVWATLDDPEYVAAMERAGLRDWTERALVQPELYAVRAAKVGDAAVPTRVSVQGQRAYYPLPFPDASVVKSVELRLRWLLETRQLGAVLRRIGVGSRREAREQVGVPAHPDWPKPGKLPVLRTQGGVWTPQMAVVWQHATRSTLRAWYRSPALYGIYAAQSKLAADLEAIEDELPATPHLRGAA